MTTGYADKGGGYKAKGASSGGSLPAGGLEGQIVVGPNPGTWTYDRIRDPNFGFELVNHFVQAVPNGAVGEFLITSLVTGSVTISGSATRPGVAVCSTGASATGRAGVQSSFTSLVRPSGTGVLVFRSRWRVPVLSDGVETHVCRLGFTDGNAGGPVTDGAFFEFNANADTSIHCVNSQGGTQTDNDSGIVLAADTDIEAEIEMSSTTVTYRLNGTQVQQFNTNAPTGAQAFGVAAGILKSLGTTARTLELDYLYLGARGF